MSEKSNLLELKRRNPDIYTDEEFLEQKRDLDEQIRVLKSEQREVDDIEEHFDQVVDIAFSYLAEPVQSWEMLEIHKKVRFQRWMFPQGLPFDGQNFGTADIALLLEIFEAASEDVPHRVGAVRTNWKRICEEIRQLRDIKLMPLPA